MDIVSILQQITNGNRQAFALIVQHYQHSLFAYLGRMGFSQAQAQEIAQEAFLRAWQHLAEFDSKRAQFSTWLFTIAYRLALNELDRAATRYELVQTDELDAIDPQALPLEQLEQAEQKQRLQQALRRLALAERSVLALAYIQGFDLTTIAQIEGCNVSAIKVRLHRARAQLRELLGE